MLSPQNPSKMQRILSVKLASNLPKTQSSSLFHFQPHKTFSLTKPPKNLFFSSIPTNPLHQEHKVHGFLSNPLLRSHISDCRLAFLQRKTPKHNSQFIPNSNCQECERRRPWFQRVSSNDMVWGLILANIAVFCVWKIADKTFMVMNFVTSFFHLRDGLAHTMITSGFSHFQVGHIFWNMLGLYLFGNNIGRVFGPGFLLKLYLAGVIGGSIFYLVHTAYLYSLKKRGLGIKNGPYASARLGASGAVTAIILLDIFLHPTSAFYFIIPVPAMMLGMFLLGQDFIRVNTGGSACLGSAGAGSTHMGGAAVAVIAWARLRKGHRVF